MAYDVTEIDWQQLGLPVARATELLTRLDERLGRSPVGEGWIQRMHFHDANAALWLEGELVHLEDLVLHDAHMDIRTPTHELTRAHTVLRARRQILGAKAGWALSREGLQQLTRRTPMAAEATHARLAGREIAGRAVPAAMDAEQLKDGEDGDPPAAEPGAIDFTDIDAVLDRTARLLDGETPPRSPLRPSVRDPLVYDLDWNEEERLSEWQAVLVETERLPTVLRAAILLDAWQSIEVLQHASWLGSLLVAEMIRQAGLSANHLACLAMGLRVIPRERRRAPDRSARLQAFFDAMTQAADMGLKEHDRLALARVRLERRLRDRRSSSRLPQLIELVLARPLVSTNMVQQQLKVSRQGALDLLGELDLREITGRKRFQAWAVS
jgi:hypothetical protein